MHKTLTQSILAVACILLSVPLTAQTYCTPNNTTGVPYIFDIDFRVPTGNGIINPGHIYEGLGNQVYTNNTGSSMGTFRRYFTSRFRVTTTNPVPATNAYPNAQLNVYIDWNNDGDFNDAGEEEYSTPVNVPMGGNNDISCNVTPSSYQAPGNYRMRIAFSQSGAPTACGGFVGETEDFTITIGDNSAPVLDNSSAPYLNELLVGQTNNDGFSIAQLLNGGAMVTDTNDKSVNNPAPRGIVITNASTGNGTWQYKIGTGSWTNIAAVNNGNALFLSDYAVKESLTGNTVRMRFVPSASGTASLTYRAWDVTSGTNGSYGAATVTGGTSAISSMRATAQISVSSSAGANPGNLYLIFNDKPTRSAAFNRSTGAVVHPEVLANTSAQQQGSEIQIDGSTGKLYWMNSTDIYTSNTDGSGEALFLSTNGGGAGIAAGDGHVFYADYDTTAEIYRVSNNGIPVLITGGPGQIDPAGFYFFDRMYYADSKLYVWAFDTLFMPQLLKMDINGQNHSIIASPSGNPSSLKVVNDTAYWVETPDNATYFIMRQPVSGAAAPAPIASTTAFSPNGLVADPANDQVFISGKRNGIVTGEVDRITISTGAISQVLSTDGAVASMAANITSSATPLPVKLVNWDAVAGNNRTAVLTWETASETPGVNFITERSSDGRNFLALSTLKGKGAGKYQFIDTKPMEGINYYRLAQAETDGSKTYTNVRAVVFERLQQPAVFPNPFDNNGLSVSLPVSTTYPVSYTLLDMKGTTVSRGTLENTGTRISGVGIAPGNYLLSVNGCLFQIVKQ